MCDYLVCPGCRIEVPIGSGHSCDSHSWTGACDRCAALEAKLAEAKREAVRALDRTHRGWEEAEAAKSAAEAKLAEVEQRGHSLSGEVEQLRVNFTAAKRKLAEVERERDEATRLLTELTAGWDRDRRLLGGLVAAFRGGGLTVRNYGPEEWLALSDAEAALATDDVPGLDALAAAEAREKALMPYVGHKQSCSFNLNGTTPDTDYCTCGLDAALAAGEKAP